MESTTTPADIAQALFDIMTPPHGHFEKGVLLLEQLHRTGALDATSAWPTAESPTSFTQALVLRHRPEEYAPSFYKPAAAQGLVRVDPACFHAKTREGNWWAWEALIGWSKCEDRSRYGMGAWEEQSLDEWATVVVSSLPNEAFDHEQAQEGWRALLILGLPKACSAFASRKPGQWLKTDARGLPMMHVGRSSNLWSQALADGVDPFLPVDLGKGKPAPLWRALLPKSSKTFPERHSFRAGVEQWLTELIEQNHEAAGEALVYKARWLTAWLGRNGETSAYESDIVWKRVVKQIQLQPSQWLSVRTPHPAWVQPFFNRTKARPKRWARLIKETPGWEQAVGPLGQVVLALFERPFLDTVPDSAFSALAASEHVQQDREWMGELADAQVWGKKGPSRQELEARLDAARFNQSLPASVGRSRGMRL